MSNSQKNCFKIKVDGISDAGLGYALLDKGEKQFYNLMIPYVLPYEEVTVKVVNDINKYALCSVLNMKKLSKNRVPSKCDHFTKCGNCLLQHWSYDNYYSWKLDLVKQPLKKMSPNTKIFQMLCSPRYGRRRAKFFSKSLKSENFVGFKKFRSNEVLNINKCIILDPEILEFIKFFKLQIKKISTSYKDIVINVNKLDFGLDILIQFDDLYLKDSLAEIFYKKVNINIVTVYFQYKNNSPELIFSMHKNKLTINSTVYSFIPPNGFIQPTKFAEDKLIEYIFEEIDKNKKVRILDLFSGSGTFSLPLANKGQTVYAIDINDNSINCLIQASKKQNLFHNIQCSVDNLMKRGLEENFLNKFDIIIIDPPRSGAFLQISKISKIKVKKLISISCDVKSFLRDARILISSGYKLLYVKPIDQFTYTKHMEIFSVFEYKN